MDNFILASKIVLALEQSGYLVEDLEAPEIWRAGIIALVENELDYEDVKKEM